MTDVTNITGGPKGIHDASGEHHLLEPGQTKDIDLAKDDEPGDWFTFDGKGGDGKKLAKTEGGKPSVVGKSHADLLAIAEAEGVTTAKGGNGEDVPVADASYRQLQAAITAHREAADA